MKKIRIAVVALFCALLCAPAFAQTPEDVEICASYGSFAYAVNTARNSGTAMSVLIQSARTATDDDAQFAVLSAIIRDVYSEPAYRTDEMQERQSIDLRNEVEALCFRTAVGGDN